MQSILPPVLEVHLAPASGADELWRGARLLADREPDISVRRDRSGDVILGANTCLRLRATMQALKQDGEIRAARRCRPAAPARIDHTVKRQRSGGGDFARVMIDVSPAADTDGGFVNAAGQGVPAEFLPGVEAGIRRAAAESVADPVVGYRAVLSGGAYHDVDSSAASFEEAACTAFERACRQAGLIACEPLAHVEITMADRDKVPLFDDPAEPWQVLECPDGSVAVAVEVDVRRLIALEDLAARLGAALTARFSRYRPIDDGGNTFRPAMGARIA